MKKLSVFAVALLMSAVAVFADSVEPKNFDAVKKVLVSNLKVDNAGVRNSTLHVIAKIRAEYPQADLTDLNSALLRVAKNDKVSYLRVSANLTYAFINNDALAEKVKNVNGEDAELFFNDLYATVNSEFFNYAD